VNPPIFRASRYVLWGEIKNPAFEDKKDFFSRNDFGTAKSCNRLRQIMAGMGVIVDDEDYTAIVMGSLPDSY
jgi:hypothetical protein